MTSDGRSKGGRGGPREESDWGLTMSNSPNLGPLETLKVATRRLLDRDADDSEEDRTVLRCRSHGLPAVCVGADLANPQYRCPRCCRADRQFGGMHGMDNYLQGHEASEGIEL